MYYCDYEIHTHHRTFMSRKTNNHHRHDKLIRVGKQNRFAKIRCFYYMKLGHTNNVCYYIKFHLNLIPKDYFEIKKLDQLKFEFKGCLISF